MEANDTFSGPSEIPRITPVSCTGKNPLGTIMYKYTVSASAPTVASSVAVWCFSTHCSVRP